MYWQAFAGRALGVLLGLTLSACGVLADGAEPLPGTGLLDFADDTAQKMVEGIHRHLDRLLGEAAKKRELLWNSYFSAADGAQPPLEIEANRARLKEILGLVDKISSVNMTVTSPVKAVSAADPIAKPVARGSNFVVHAVSWTVFRDVHGEGLLLLPDRDAVADVIAVPDCDWSPEQAVGLLPGVDVEDQFPRRLAEAGCRVLVPSLIDRGNRFSGNPGVRQTKHSQRETLWRASYELGRTPLGYELQKIFAAADWFESTRSSGAAGRSDHDVEANPKSNAPSHPKIGIIGYGEGGLLALLAGAIDERFEAVGVCGAFGLCSRLPEQPIDRNVWSFLERFGDAELGAMILPRALCVEFGKYPEVALTDQYGGAPGSLWRPTRDQFDAELRRIENWRAGSKVFASYPAADSICSTETAREFLAQLAPNAELNKQPGPAPAFIGAPAWPDPAARTLRQYLEILEDTQHLMREAEYARREFWKRCDFTGADAFQRSAEEYRSFLRTNVIGVLTVRNLPPNPRSRFLFETNNCRSYEVMLDVCDDVFAYGILVVPKGLKSGERHPVVVCQHGLEGRPCDVADPRIDNPAYHAFAWRLAERGFVTFAPQNPYIGGTRFRQLLRKSQPLGLTLWSFILRQHEVITDWLANLDFVDPDRIGFYGLSYGGKTALRIPPLVARYSLSICSADFNEWVWKNVSARAQYSYLWTAEYDMPEWNLANTFNHAELAWLIFPRPFMVERGHRDGVAPDEWVAYEFARVRRHYVSLGFGDRAEIEFFDGPHTINGVGTFDFLHRHLRWPGSGK
jgi:dienelactone hydrolase